jgi:DNA-binding NarL/FixJ family response regulator
MRLRLDSWTVHPQGAATSDGKLLRILIADEQALFREAVRAVLEAESDMHVVAEAGTEAFAVSEARRTRPDAALIDAGLPGGGGIAAAKAIVDSIGGCRVLVLSGEGDERLLLDAVETGVGGFVTKESALSDLIDALRRVVRGEVVVPPMMLGPLLKTLLQRRNEQEQVLDRLSRLTSRETQVLRLLVQGADNASIGSILAISPQTARTHVQNILTKLRVHSRLEAAAFVMQGGVLDRLDEAEHGPMAAAAEARLLRRWRTADLHPAAQP